jgi:hypothetical protein
MTRIKALAASYLVLSASLFTTGATPSQTTVNDCLASVAAQSWFHAMPVCLTAQRELWNNRPSDATNVCNTCNAPDAATFSIAKVEWYLNYSDVNEALYRLEWFYARERNLALFNITEAMTYSRHIAMLDATRKPSLAPMIKRAQTMVQRQRSEAAIAIRSMTPL